MNMNVTPLVSEHRVLKITRTYLLKIKVEFCDHKTFVMDRKACKCYMFEYLRTGNIEC